MNKDIAEVGTMLYRGLPKILGWVVNRFDENNKHIYYIEWANGEVNTAIDIEMWIDSYNDLANER